MAAKRMVAWIKVALGVGALCALTACSSSRGGSGDSLADLGIDDGASKGTSKSAQLSVDRDTHIELETGALVDVPAGAVTKGIQITVARPDDGKALKLVDRFKTSQDRIVSAPYVLTPHGTTFKEDVTVTLPLSKTGAREVSVAWLEDEDDTEWKVLGVAKTSGKKASISLKHFSVLVVVEDASDLEPVDDMKEDPSEDAGAPLDAGDALDAGAAMDAASVADSGGGTVDKPDASGGLDASKPADAGSATPDSGDDTQDAGPVSPDAAGTSEAGTVIDSSTGPTDAASPLDAEAGADAGGKLSMYAKLEACGYVVSPGGFEEWGVDLATDPWNDPYSLCIHRCFSAGTCQDVQTYRCGLDAGVSQGVADCLSTCPSQPLLTCPGDPQETLAYRCDAVSQCPGAEDETGCDPGLFFDCGNGEHFPKYRQCNGIMDCANNQDEVDCHVCDSERTMPPSHVCNGIVECNDLTDEPASCAVITCGSPLID